MFNKQRILLERWLELTQIAGTYGNNNIVGFKPQIDKFIMRVPLVGLFSAGKSTLVNGLLDEKLLSVEITPETCLATELYFSKDESYTGHFPNGKQITLTKEDLKDQNFNELLDYDADGKQGHVSVYLNAPVLAQFPHICLVDLPGLESNHTSHTQIVDNYIQQSLAYCIVVSCEDGEIRASTQQFLQELKIHNAPVILVVTKADSKPEADVSVITTKITESVTQLLGKPPLDVVAISARKKKNLEELVQAFVAIENKAEIRFDDVVVKPLVNEMAFLTQNLDKLINSDNIKVEELQAKKETFELELTDYKKKLAGDTERLKENAALAINKIVNLANSRLTAQLETFAESILNQQDISESINNTVRAAVAEGIQEEFVPLIQKYVQNAEASLPESIKIAAPHINGIDVNDSQNTFTTIGMMLTTVPIPHPVIAIVVKVLLPIVGKILDKLISDSRKKEKLEAKKEEARQAILNQVIPQAMNSVRSSVNTSVSEGIASTTKSIENLVNERANQVNHQLAQLEQDIQQGKEEQQQKIAVYRLHQTLLDDLSKQLTEPV